MPQALVAPFPHALAMRNLHINVHIVKRNLNAAYGLQNLNAAYGNEKFGCKDACF